LVYLKSEGSNKLKIMHRFKFSFKVLLFLLLVALILLAVLNYFWPRKAGLLVITNQPATVFINGKKEGKIPFEASFNPSEVTLKLVPDDNRLAVYETKIKLEPGVKTILQRDLGDSEGKSAGVLVSFEKLGGRKTAVSVISIPDSAQVVIDGQPRGVTPYQLTGVTPGEHNLEIFAADYNGKSIKVRIYPGYKLTAFFQLLPFTPTNSSESLAPADNYLKIKLKKGRGKEALREKPLSTAKIMGEIKEDDWCSVLETSEDKKWYRVDCPNKGSGWVEVEFFERES